jgi:predicted nucleic acid-binding protein
MVDRTDLIEVVPILGSDITKYREEVHDRIILNAIHILNSDNFTINELNDKIDEIFEIKYPKERLIHHLEKLFINNIEYSKGRIHLTQEIPPVTNEINDLIEICFKEFINKMKEEYNPALHQRYRDTFYELIYETCKNILSSTNIIKLNMDPTDFGSNNLKMEEIVRSHNLPNVSKFLAHYYGYLSSESLNKDNIILSIFQYAISLDILERGSELYTASKDYEEKGILVIDTNILTSLILKSNRFHETVESMITLSHKLGFKIFYTSDTEMEFERLIEGANYNISKRKSYSELDRDNELVHDYLKDNSVENWADKLIYYNSFKLILKRDYEITVLEEPITEDDADFSEFLREVYRISMMTHKVRLPLAIEHDINLLNLMYHLKTKDSIKMFDSPWIVTLDNLLIYVSGYVMRKKETNCEYCIHAQKWFDLLIPFCDIEDIRNNQKKFVSAILKYSIIPFDNRLSLNEYTKLLANKFGLEGVNSDIILEVISRSRLQYQLEYSLERNSIKDTKNITYEVFTNDKLIDELLEKKEDKKL